jgi:hypothetical protein
MEHMPLLISEPDISVKGPFIDAALVDPGKKKRNIQKRVANFSWELLDATVTTSVSRASDHKLMFFNKPAQKHVVDPALQPWVEK